jgi:hypothetical protein
MDDAMWRLGLAFGAALALLAGCGESDESPGGGSEREQIEAVVVDYMHALADGDGEQACARLTSAAQKSLAAGTGAESCAAGVEQLAGSLDSDARTLLGSVEVTVNDITGSKATVKVAAGEAQPPGPVPLEKADGEWRITAFASGVNFSSQDEAECVAGGMSAFDDGEGDGFWRKEGRSDFRDYIVEVCRRADRRGAFKSNDRDEFDAIAREVILEMVKRGQIRDPRR